MSPRSSTTKSWLWICGRFERSDRLSFLFLGAEKTLQLPGSCGVAQFAQRLGFNLADAFAGDLVLFAHLLERAHVAVHEPKPQFEHLPLALGQTAQDVP